ncbi:MAG: hypothetical protein WAW61_06830 [Methylococcaceae bacterium]
MTQKQSNNLILKILVIGALIAALVYFFHPGVGQFSLIIDGQPVADPLIRFAAIPAFLIVMVFTAVLMLLAFLGVGMFLFIAALVFVMLGIFIVAPYFWPMLAIIFLLILLMSFR